VGLALRNPMSLMLRILIAMMKIAKTSAELYDGPFIPLPENLVFMATQSTMMMASLLLSSPPLLPPPLIQSPALSPNALFHQLRLQWLIWQIQEYNFLALAPGCRRLETAIKIADGRVFAQLPEEIDVFMRIALQRTYGRTWGPRIGGKGKNVIRSVMALLR
jgi:hypothetical protein